ncbi:mechanosensitive ion channel family protein [Marilutibacter chinensis]|uniref:Mechanosensitive ion channel n=1 Tax=Marilutibacter chinensis TaxID=2912247 RepID=A0ABS9HTS6_9GAMM|nr:mechanosensitive ion channel domain-containing protein [Lysobacter chinensis]MCF7222295.1 mechanosensitive ion channel [Lysobacter chinensis]
MTAAPASDSLEAAGERAREVADAALQKGSEGLQPLLDFTLFRIGGSTVTVAGLLAAIAVVAAALVVSMLLRRALSRYGERHLQVNPASLYTVSRMVHYILIALGILIALDLVGIPVAKFAIFAGALGVGLGFGLQAIFNNFISGLILLFDKSLKVGDFVELETGTRGTVRAINIRATQITTNDNIDILVPNSEFVSGRVVNWTHGSSQRRIRVPFGVAYGTDKERVKQAALEAAARVPFTLALEGRQAPQVWLTGFGDSAVEFILAVWLSEEAAGRNAAIEAAYLWELDTSLKEHGIEIPFPQRDLHIRSVFGQQGDAALAIFGRNPPVPGESDPALPAAQDTAPPAPSSNDALLEVERGSTPVEPDVDRENDSETDARER